MIASTEHSSKGYAVEYDGYDQADCVCQGPLQH